ncbi:MAG: glycosyltransferase family 2 protein [Myxococcota bacterium]|nr:glycosyltransferase family 2 protein [Myxococcota bacterium]
MSGTQSDTGTMPVESGRADRRVLVMIPALNEEVTIKNVIEAMPRDIPGVASVDVVVIDDGCTDRTAQFAREAGASVIRHGQNLGVGVALHSGLDEAIRRGVDIAVNIDADGQFNPNDIPKLIRPILMEEAHFVTASRFKDKSLIPQMPAMKIWGNHRMAQIVSYLTGKRMYDVSCGFRAYSREALLQLVLTGRFTYTQETLLVLASKGLVIDEMPMVVRGEREFGTSRVASNLWRYGTKTMGIIFGVIRDYRPGVLFNSVAGFLAVVGLMLATFFFWHRFNAGTFQPNIWAGFMSAYLLGLAAITFGLGQVALMVGRLRAVQDKQLYLLRRHLARSDDRPPKG